MKNDSYTSADLSCCSASRRLDPDRPEVGLVRETAELARGASDSGEQQRSVRMDQREPELRPRRSASRPARGGGGARHGHESRHEIGGYSMTTDETDKTDQPDNQVAEAITSLAEQLYLV